MEDDAFYPPASTQPRPSTVNQSYTLLNTRQTPIPLRFTWSKSAIYPAKLGIRKDVYALGDLLRFRAKADFILHSGKFVYGFSVRDTLLNGRFSVNVPARLLAYQKNLGLPNGMVACLSAGTQYVGGGAVGSTVTTRPHFKPYYGLHVRFGGGVDHDDEQRHGHVIVGPEGGFQIKQRVPVPLSLLWPGLGRFTKKHGVGLDIETYSTIKLPHFGGGGLDGRGLGGGGLSFGSPVPDTVFHSGGAVLGRNENDALHLHVQGINAVIRL